MTTCKAVLRQTVESLVRAGVPEAETDAWYLFEYVTGMNRAAYFLHMEDAMDKVQEDRLIKLTKLRAERIPLQ